MRVDMELEPGVITTFEAETLAELAAKIYAEGFADGLSTLIKEEDDTKGSI